MRGERAKSAERPVPGEEAEPRMAGAPMGAEGRTSRPLSGAVSRRGGALLRPGGDWVAGRWGDQETSSGLRGPCLFEIESWKKADVPPSHRVPWNDVSPAQDVLLP